jgi:DNA-binding LytR/AlgR family response regulator
MMKKNMKPLQCVIADDEPLAAEILQDYIDKIPYLELITTFENGIETLHYLKENEADLLFLDIQMPDLTGIQLVEVLKFPPMVIFTTAYENYALKSYELDAVDYLLKPIGFDRFLVAIEKAMERKKMIFENNLIDNSKLEKLTTSERHFIFVKTEHRMQKVFVDDILYIEGMKNYLRIVTHKERIMTLSNFKNMEEVLPPEKFQRIHKSFLIALDKIDNIERNRVCIKDKMFPVSETYKEEFYKKIRDLSI